MFNNWNDVEYLEKFFEENKEDLKSGFFGTITIEDAVFRTIEESKRFETFIRKTPKREKINPNSTLQNLVFTPLKKMET